MNTGNTGSTGKKQVSPTIGLELGHVFVGFGELEVEFFLGDKDRPI
jgi:hypothetical protein